MIGGSVEVGELVGVGGMDVAVAVEVGGGEGVAVSGGAVGVYVRVGVGRLVGVAVLGAGVGVGSSDDPLEHAELSRIKTRIT